MISLLALLTVLASPPSAGPPTEQTVVYYNARVALREGRPADALRLYLLRNTIANVTQTVSGHDADLGSVAWAALGALGLCQDGMADDADGAGLWPLAQHNWLVYAIRRPDVIEPAAPFDAFLIAKQQRFVSMGDVLDAEELRNVRFGRTGCVARERLLFAADQSVFAERRDRIANANVLQYLLRKSLRTLDQRRVVGRSALAARVFDLDLQIVALEARKTRRKDRADGRAARRLGERVAPKDVRFGADTEPGRVLRESLRWPAEEWMTLSSQRRQFLLGHALRNVEDPSAGQALLLAVIDRLIADRAGAEVQSWIAHATKAAGADSTAVKQQIWGGARGRALLALDEATGFKDRGAIALYRGIHALSTGALPDALRAFAEAMRWAESSQQGEAVRGLARRWLSYVASRFQVTEPLLDMLQAVLPRTDLRAVLDDQVWHAALQADRASFDQAMKRLAQRGASRRRSERLAPLAAGDIDGFLKALDDAFVDSPNQSLRFMQRYLERLQTQDAATRRQHRPLLERLRRRLVRMAEPMDGRRGLRRAQTNLTELDAIVEGLDAVGGGLDPDQQVFAGSVRVAPSDTPPWPFVVADVQAPPVFTPVDLRPIEWRDAEGRLIFGWRVGDGAP